MKKHFIKQYREFNMRYFTVEKEYLVGEVFRYEVNSDGTRASERYNVDSEDIGTKMVVALTVNEYDEQGMLVNVEFYPVISDTRLEPMADDTGRLTYQNNEEDVLAEIYNDHPASEWQNNNW